MAEQDTDTALDETTDKTGESEGQETQETQEEQKLNETQLQQIGSLVGRIVANQLETKVMPEIKEETNPDAAAARKEKLLEMVFDGRIDEVVDNVLDERNTKKQTASQKAVKATRQALTKFSSEENYKDMYPDMEKIAGKYLARGYPPEAAAEMANAKAKVNFLEGRQPEANGDLGMTTGGKRPPGSTKKVKLPSQFKAAMKRDVGKGLFKNEQDWIDNGLSPQIRAKYDL